MEFASEMIVKSLQAQLSVAEVPTRLAKDGRGRPPHLNTWRDGWRHLRYLLLYSPRWLFLYPGIAFALLGLMQLIYANIQLPELTRWPVGIHTQLFASAAMILGYQTMLFALGAVLARQCAGLDTPDPREQGAVKIAQGPWLTIGGGLVTLLGVLLCAGLTLEWGRSGFGALNPEVAMRQVIPGVALVLIGTQSVLASIFFSAMRSAFDSSRPVHLAAGSSAPWREAAP